MKAKTKVTNSHNFGPHNDARKMLMKYHGISSRSAAKALKYINQFK
jgi:hypothetical protein